MANLKILSLVSLVIIAAYFVFTRSEDTKPIGVDGDKIFTAEEIAQFDGSDVS